MMDRVTKSIIVDGDVGKAFHAWENFENFPLFMSNVKSVEKTGADTSHWVIQGPMGKDIEWTAETTSLEPNKRIGWSTKDARGDVTTSGQVTFSQLPQDQTQVTVTLQYDPMGGKAGQVIAQIFANPEKMLGEDLRNFKNYVEGSEGS